MGPDEFGEKEPAPACPLIPSRKIFHADWHRAADNKGSFQAIALPGLEATWDCPREEREEGKAFRRARRECRREQLEDGEVDRADDYYGSEEGNYIEQEKQDLQDEYLESESEDSLESDLLDYEYHDNCSTYYDGRQVEHAYCCKQEYIQ